MAVTINEFSDEMLARYFQTYFSAWDIFRTAVNGYERRKLEPGVTMEERNDIEVKLLWLHGEHAKMMQRRTAFLRGALAINRPSIEQFETTKQLAKRVEEITDAATRLDTLTDISMAASEVLASIHNERGTSEEADVDESSTG